MQALFEARGLRKTYGAREVVRGVDLWVAPGEVLAIVGPNGAGKTTTLELILGLRQPDQGDIVWSLSDFRTQTGVQLQTTPFFPGLNASEHLVLFGALYGVALSSEEARKILARCGLQEVAHCDAARLSGGQQKRLAIALALAHQPSLLFLDEPTAALDPRAQAEVRALIQSLSQNKTAVVFTSHDMNEVTKLADRVAIFHQGRVLACGAPGELIKGHNAESLEALYLRLTE